MNGIQNIKLMLKGIMYQDDRYRVSKSGLLRKFIIDMNRCSQLGPGAVMVIWWLARSIRDREVLSLNPAAAEKTVSKNLLFLKLLSVGTLGISGENALTCLKDKSQNI